MCLLHTLTVKALLSFHHTVALDDELEKTKHQRYSASSKQVSMT